MFRRLVRLGSLPAYWRQANVTQIPRGPPSSFVTNCRPISITSVLSKVFERFMERSGVPLSLLNGNFLVTCDALLCVSYTLEGVLECGLGARI